MPDNQSAMPNGLLSLPTPSLILDEAKMQRNIDRLSAHISALGGRLRPHLKTVKSIEIARRLLPNGDGPATVSTLREAAVFAQAGVRDIIYAVGIAPHKLDQVAQLRADGCDLAALLDSMEQAEAVVETSLRSGAPIPALIEIDCDGHRGGLAPGDPAIVAIARRLAEGGAEFRGVLTHAGESYNVTGDEAHAACAEQERAAVADVAALLREQGLPCPVVSMGSTPTAHAVRDLSGVTEVRAGVYVFFDLVQAGIGVCAIDDIALSVLTTVIGYGNHHGVKTMIVDAGWMAMSRDRGTADQTVDQGYGLVCDIEGRPLADLIISEANQEHGLVSVRPGSDAVLPDLPVGARLRILPNHACATAAQFPAYDVIPANPDAPLARWERFGGW